MSVIEVKQVTKDYGNQKGVFDVSFCVEKGEAVGFLGPNGAGKTTTIRQLMGFIKPDKGSVSILSMNCFQEASKIQQHLGYLPGEIAFMEEMSGKEFISFIAKMKGIKDMTRANELIHYLEFDPKGKTRKMSKGMKQKIGLVCALMNDPDILILDEPTSGLDPLMQNKFVDLMLAEKKKGTTILMSSHIFEEVEQTCDRVVIIKEGHIIKVEEMETLKKGKKKIYEIVFHEEREALQFVKQHKNITINGNRISFAMAGNADVLIKELSQYTIDDIATRTQTLEELFLQFYGGEAS